MNVQDSRWIRALIYVPCGAAVWGGAAWLDGSADWRVIGLSTVCGVFLGLLFSVVRHDGKAAPW